MRRPDFVRRGAARLLVVMCFIVLSARAAGPGSALLFQHTLNQYIEVPGFGANAPSNAVTIEMWVTSVTLGRSFPVLSLSPNTAANQIRIVYPNSDGDVQSLKHPKIWGGQRFRRTSGTRFPLPAGEGSRVRENGLSLSPA